MQGIRARHAWCRPACRRTLHRSIMPSNPGLLLGIQAPTMTHNSVDFFFSILFFLVLFLLSCTAGSPKGFPLPKHSLHRSPASWAFQQANAIAINTTVTIKVNTLTGLLGVGARGSWMQPGAVPFSGHDRLNPSGQLQCCRHMGVTWQSQACEAQEPMRVCTMHVLGFRVVLTDTECCDIPGQAISQSIA